MEDSRFLQSLQLENFLSYGSESEEIELQSLNVLIGSNASGKSNLIEAIALLKATPIDLPAPIRQGGGISNFLWKGSKETPVARIKAIINYPQGLQPLSYELKLSSTHQKLDIIDETIATNTDTFYNYLSGYSILKTKSNSSTETQIQNFTPGWINPQQSILSQRKDPYLYPEISYLGNKFANICLYRESHIGRYSKLRNLQKTDLPENPLLEDGSNLGLFLNHLQYQLGNREIIEKLRKFYDIAEELIVKISGGTVQIYIREEGLIQPIPATRLSDGTLHYLFLMALLLDPTPPPLICIEEPEIGFHPDILPVIAEMLVEASQRTQLIVTTHSDVLVSAIPPESVLVCERSQQKGTYLRRLQPEQLENWLENYTVGDLWRMGEIGGTRW
ncbi:AAA family ATPase [Rivularia sp. UHCC 0363]|uniref:AAA family ATPase n=1 Tax=Rivularia sp. UHCC 0363 TaxID=3110244 RepID=UPI002B20B703|nr:AAA family ATPase [Rivularia sp. UHCC 0363]MEA5595007.1 AAA family ATPase [Rivularia sp. UHCC 0363]